MNVLVYVVDCLRSDHVSCYGHARETTPNVDALAEDGVRYEACYAPSTWTRPVSVSLLSGAYPPTHGVRHRKDGFPPDVDSLQAVLSRAGLRTVAVSTIGNVSSALGYDAGFSAFVDLYREEAIVKRRESVSTRRQRLVHEEREGVALPRAEDVNEYLLPHLEPDGDDFFAFCWSIDPHMPLDPPPGYREYVDPAYDGPVDGGFDSLPKELTAADVDHLVNLYDGEVRYTDEQLGRLLSALKASGLYDDTLVVVLGDHGEAFDEHGFRFHGNRPHEELVRVPLVVKPPEGAETSTGIAETSSTGAVNSSTEAETSATGTATDTDRRLEHPVVVTDPVSLVDVFPTVLDLLGIEARPGHVQGRVLPPFGPPAPDRAVFSHTQIEDVEPEHVSVREGRWKYIRTRTPPPNFVIARLYGERETVPGLRYALVTLRDSVAAALSGSPDERLYDLAVDPGERRNLVRERPDVAARLGRRIEDWRRECEDARAGRIGEARADVDAGTREQLKQLGYTK